MSASAAQIQNILLMVAKEVRLDRYDIRVTLSPKPDPEDEKGTLRPTLADMSAHGLDVQITIFPAFFKRPLLVQKETLCHELGHVALHDYTTTAEELAGNKFLALLQLEEKLADFLGRLILAKAEETVDFSALES